MNVVRGWWHSFWSGVTKDATAMWNAIWSGVDNVVSWAEDWIDRIASAMDWVWRHVGTIYTFLRAITVSVWHAIDGVWKWTTHTFFPWVGRMFADAYRFIGGAVTVVEHWVSHLWSDLWHWTRSSFSWLNSHVLVPLWRDLTGAVHWITTTMWHIIWVWVKDLGHWAARGFTYLFDHLASTISWLDRHVAKWAGVLDKYAGVMLRFLLDPFGFVAHLLETAATRGARWFVGLLVHALADFSGPVEDWLARFLSI